MANEIRGLSRDVLEDVRGACEKSGRPTTEAEVRRTLDLLDPRELDTVRRLARAGVGGKPLSPDALVDIARGTSPEKAAARELGGYYEVLAERDALALMRAPAKAPPTKPAYVAPVEEPEDDEDESDEDADDDFDESEADADFDDEDDADAAAAAAADARADARSTYSSDYDDESDDDSDEAEESADAAPEEPSSENKAPPDALTPSAPTRGRAKVAIRVDPEETRKLVTLFAYHRDAVRVAQELNLGIGELNDLVESLGLRRRIHRMLEQTTDIDIFTPDAAGVRGGGGSTAPVLRRRADLASRPEGTPDEPRAREPRDTGPAAETTAVNAHGTRVYRRSPETTTKATPAVDGGPGFAARREYVREGRRRGKVAPRTKEPAPAKATPAIAAVPAAPARRPFSELQATSGGAILEKLIADEKANPRVLAGRLGERFAGAADRPLSEGDLRALLQHHGLADTFLEREITNTRFLIGFHQGARAKLANALQMTQPELGTYLNKLGLGEELERTRGERARLELGRRKIHDRIVQVLTRAPYLDDLGVLAVIDREVRAHILELFETRGAKPGGDAAASEAIREELGVEPNAFLKLLRRYELIAPV